MKLYTKLIISLLSFPSFIFSQTLDANVLGSSGNFFLNDKSVSYTIGEVIVYHITTRPSFISRISKYYSSKLYYDCSI